MPYYYTDHNKFYNPFAMFAYAAVHTPNTFPTFDIYDSEFDKFDWTKEPTDSFETLLERRAVQLRCKYDRLVLYFSGGTDSSTMYRIFKKLNIHLDEIVITYEKDDIIGMPLANVKWLKENHYDPTTIITAIDTHNVPAPFYSSLPSNFIVDPLFTYVPSYFGGTVVYRRQRQGEERFSNYKCAYIIGAEKPHIECINGQWYARQLDKVYSGFLDMGQTEWFFVTPDLPELHIKQSHLLKNAAKAHLDPSITRNWESSSFAGKSSSNYYTHASWCGRDSDVNPGVSFTQKTFSQKNPMDILKILKGEQNYITKDTSFDKYITAFKEFQHDATIIDYMIKFGLLDPGQSIDQYYGIHSKKYSLGV